MKIKHLLFDLDNTLYPSTSAMDAGITKRMMECVAEFFHCDTQTAYKIRAEKIGKFSTTLEWLRSEGLTDIEAYLAHVHPENEADELQPQENLRELLISLPYQKSILTNANHEHAHRVLKKLGIEDLFVTVSDIRDAGFKGKPYWNAYDSALKKVGAEIQTTLFLDDMWKYTDGWTIHGGNAVLVGPKNGNHLAPDALPMLNAPQIPAGKTFKIPDIFSLPDLLKTIDNN